MPLERPDFNGYDLNHALALIRQKALLRLDQKGWGTFASADETLGIITEGYHELIAAVTAGDPEAIVDELLDLAVAAYLGIACRSQQDW